MANTKRVQEKTRIQIELDNNRDKDLILLLQNISNKFEKGSLIRNILRQYFGLPLTVIGIPASAPIIPKNRQAEIKTTTPIMLVSAETQTEIPPDGENLPEDFDEEFRQ